MRRRIGTASRRNIRYLPYALTEHGAIMAAMLAGVLGDLISNLMGLTGEGAWAGPLLIMNLIFSATSVAILIFVFTKRVWKLTLKQSVLISIAAGILTNPAWAMGLWFFQ